MSFVLAARSHISIPTAHSRFKNKEELNSTNTYFVATQILHVLRKRTKSSGVLKFLKALKVSTSTITYPQTRNTQIQMIWDKTWQNSSLTKNISRNISVPIKLIVDEKQAHYPSIWQYLHTVIYLVSPYLKIHSVSLN
jgi:hypothetical protein